MRDGPKGKILNAGIILHNIQARILMQVLYGIVPNVEKKVCLEINTPFLELRALGKFFL